MQPLPEADWRLSRDLGKRSLERLFERTLAEAAGVATDPAVLPRDRYHRLCQLIRERDRELADTFDNPRRSVAVLQLMRQGGLGLITDEEFARFSDETRRRVAGSLDLQ
jgi:hypothetical protein